MKPLSSPVSWLIIQRGISLLVGAAYLVFLSTALAALTGMPASLAAVVVVFAATVQMLILLFFASRFIRPNRHERQFGLTSTMLIILATSIYFAAIGLIVRKAQESSEDIHFGALPGLIVLSVCYICLSTIILLYLSDSLMWLAVCIVRLRSKMIRQRRNRIPFVEGQPRSGER